MVNIQLKALFLPRVAILCKLNNGSSLFGKGVLAADWISSLFHLLIADRSLDPIEKVCKMVGSNLQGCIHFSVADIFSRWEYLESVLIKESCGALSFADSYTNASFRKINAALSFWLNVNDSDAACKSQALWLSADAEKLSVAGLIIL